MLTFHRITTVDDPFLKKMESTYRDAFPYNERRDFSEAEDLLAHNPVTTVNAILDEDKYVGFLTYWTFEDFIYAEHFGIEKNLRNKGLGEKAFGKFLTEGKLPIVGEVENPVDELTRRRVELYKRLGMKLYNHPYPHPAFHKGEETINVCMVSYGDINLEKDFEKVQKYLYKYVY